MGFPVGFLRLSASELRFELPDDSAAKRQQQDDLIKPPSNTVGLRMPLFPYHGPVFGKGRSTEFSRTLLMFCWRSIDHRSQ